MDVEDSLRWVSRKEGERWTVVVGGGPGRCSLEHLPHRASLRRGPILFRGDATRTVALTAVLHEFERGSPPTPRSTFPNRPSGGVECWLYRLEPKDRSAARGQAAKGAVQSVTGRRLTYAGLTGRASPQ